MCENDDDQGDDDCFESGHDGRQIKERERARTRMIKPVVLTVLDARIDLMATPATWPTQQAHNCSLFLAEIAVSRRCLAGTLAARFIVVRTLYARLTSPNYMNWLS